MPQVKVTDIRAPLNNDRCKLDVKGGLISSIVELGIKAFYLPYALESESIALNTVLPNRISQIVNEKIAAFYQPIAVSLSLANFNETNNDTVVTAVLNYTQANNIQFTD